MPRVFASFLLPLTLLICAAAAHANDSPTLARIKANKAINLGVRDSSVPFSFLDEAKQSVGYSVDLCLAVVDAIRGEIREPRLQVNYVPVTSSTRIPAVLAGKVDLECGSTTNTRDRQLQVSFAYTTFVAGVKLLARKSSNIRGLEELSGKTVVVTKGTTAEKIIDRANEERRLNITKLVSHNHAQSFQAVEDGRAAAFPMDDVLLYGLIAKSKQPEDFEVVGKYLSVEPYGIMLAKNDPGFERIVNAALVAQFNNGRAQKTYDKWFNGRHMRMPMSQNLRESFAYPNTHPAFP